MGGEIGEFGAFMKEGGDFSMANLVEAVDRESEYDLHKINSSKE